MDMNGEPIVVEQTFNAPDQGGLEGHYRQGIKCANGFFETMIDFDPESGFETQFNVRCEDRDYSHLWKVTDVVPELADCLRTGDTEGTRDETQLILWELSETPNGTKLKLTHEGHETFPQDDPVFSRDSGQSGWDWFICESLKAFLERQSA